MSESNFIPNNLKKIREELGKTQEQLGKDLGVDCRTIRAYESENDNNCKKLPIEKALKISNMFGYSLDYIYCQKSKEQIYQNKFKCDIRKLFFSDENNLYFKLPLKYWDLFNGIMKLSKSGKTEMNIKEDTIKLFSDYEDFDETDVVFQITMPKEQFSEYIQSAEGLIPYSSEHETTIAKHRPTEEEIKRIVDFFESLTKSE